MSVWLFIYILTGYVSAFNYCKVQELKGRTLGLLDTGIVILIYTVLWLPLNMLDIYLNGILAMYQTLDERRKL